MDALAVPFLVVALPFLLGWPLAALWVAALWVMGRL